MTETPKPVVAALHVKEFLDAQDRHVHGHMPVTTTHAPDGSVIGLERGDLRALLAERNELLLRADRAENARDQAAGQLAETRNLLAASGRAEAIATALRTYADKLDAVPLECTALTGPVWYGQGWRDAVNHLRDLTDGLRTEPVAARGPDAGSAA